MIELTIEELEQILFDMDEKITSFDKEHISRFYLDLRDKVNEIINIRLKMKDCAHKWDCDSVLFEWCKTCGVEAFDFEFGAHP